MNPHDYYLEDLLTVVDHLIDEAISHADKQPEVAAVQQLIENSRDAAATMIRILLTPGSDFIVVDNGRGLTLTGQKDFDRLNTFMRLKEGKDPRKDCGKNNSGRIVPLGISEGLEYWSATGKSGETLLRANITRMQIAHMLADRERTYRIPHDDLNDLPDWLRKFIAPGTTGTAVRLRNVDWDNLRTIKKKSLEKFKRELSYHLGPWVTRLVHFVNQDGTEVPLPEYYMDDPFEVHEEDTEIGRVRWALYRLPREKREPRDVIRIGGYNPLMRLSKFVGRIHHPEILAQGIPDWMFTNEVAGYIDLGIINAHAAHDRNNVQERLFADHALVRKIVEVIIKIGSAAGARYHLGERQIVRTKGKGLQEVADLFEKVGVAVKPVVDTPEEGVIITPRYSEVITGERVELALRRGKKGGQWDVPAEAGTIQEQIKDGRGIALIVGHVLGEHVITYTEQDGTRSGQCTIEHVVRRTMRISPGLLPVEAVPFQHELTLDNCDSDAKDITWDFQNLPETVKPYLHLSPIAGTKSCKITVDAGCPVGTYTIVAQTPHGMLQCNVWIKEVLLEATELILVNDRPFVLTQGTRDDPPVSVQLRPKMYPLANREGHITVDGSIKVDTDAVQFRLPPDERRRRIVDNIHLKVLAEMVVKSASRQEEVGDAIRGLIQRFDALSEKRSLTEKK